MVEMVPAATAAVGFANAHVEDCKCIKRATIKNHAKKEEARFGKLQLSKEADRLKWHFLILQDDERHQHAVLAMVTMVHQPLCRVWQGLPQRLPWLCDQ